MSMAIAAVVKANGLFARTEPVQISVEPSASCALSALLEPGVRAMNVQKGPKAVRFEPDVTVHTLMTYQCIKKIGCVGFVHLHDWICHYRCVNVVLWGDRYSDQPHWVTACMVLEAQSATKCTR